MGKWSQSSESIQVFFLRRSIVILSDFIRADKLYNVFLPLAMLLKSKVLRNCLFFGEQFIYNIYHQDVTEAVWPNETEFTELDMLQTTTKRS